MRFTPKDTLDRVFQIGLFLKGADGLLEVAGGLLLLVVSPAAISRIVAGLTRHELSEDPHDFVATHLLDAARGLTGSATAFGAIYLLSHGAAKIFLVAALLTGRWWAYPWMIVFLLLFIAYQLYRIALSPSVGLAALTVFDAALAWLTYVEWRRHRRSLPG